jgi:hypothetical protein
MNFSGPDHTVINDRLQQVAPFTSPARATEGPPLDRTRFPIESSLGS